MHFLKLLCKGIGNFKTKKNCKQKYAVMFRKDNLKKKILLQNHCNQIISQESSKVTVL